MKIFEDLIEELKEENLLEETVIETSKGTSENTYNQPLKKDKPTFTLQSEIPQHQEETIDDGINLPSFSSNPQPVSSVSMYSQIEELAMFEAFQEDSQENNEIEEPDDPLAFQKSPVVTSSIETLDDQFVQSLLRQNDSLVDTVIQEESLINQEELSEDLLVKNNEENSFELSGETENPLLSKDVIDDDDFFRRRATEEVNSLKIVEHVLSAIEREYKKTLPKAYDDLSVSMALHDFLKVTEKPNSPEHSQAEFKLMQETESWYSALSQRDKYITVAELRRYCENAKPALSSQALISLARFYRNSPFSEAVRSKFDMILTRLLTKEKWDDTRELIFTREELITQISNLYADWASIPLYESNDDDSDVLIGVLKFEDFAHEAVSAETFDELIRNDFFNRLKIFKEGTGEKFFAPLLVATVIESNVIVGNKYVELVQQEREKLNTELLEERDNFLLDQLVSDATSKTLQLVEVLKEKKEPTKSKVQEEEKEVFDLSSIKTERKPIKATKPKHRVNKALVAITVLALLFLGGLFIWSTYLTTEIKVSTNVVKINLDNSSVKPYFKDARVSKEILFVVVEPLWNQSSDEVKEDVLKKTMDIGGQQGFNSIHVLNVEGKTIGNASSEGITLNIR